MHFGDALRDDAMRDFIKRGVRLQMGMHVPSVNKRYTKLITIRYYSIIKKPACTLKLLNQAPILKHYYPAHNGIIPTADSTQ